MSQHSNKCIRAITILLFVMLFLMPQAVYADVDNPLVDALRCPRLEGANVVGNGGIISELTNVDYEEVTIDLFFSHNVADVSLRENNQKAISVVTEDGEYIPVEIGFSDAFADRCSIYVTMHNLYPATKYYIYVAASLKAYNGSYANVDSKTFFTTKAEVVHDGSEDGYDQGETDSGHDSGGESQGEETADKTKEETGNPGEEITEDNMVIITDNGRETTDPEEEEKDEEEENDEEKEEEDEPEMQKKSGDEKTGAVIQNPGENPEGGSSPEILSDMNGIAGAFGNAETAGVQEADTAPEQETSEETETQKAEPNPEPEQEKTQELQTEQERQQTARNGYLTEGQQTARDSRLPEEMLAGVLAAALLLAAVADRMRKGKAAGYERKEV